MWSYPCHTNPRNYISIENNHRANQMIYCNKKVLERCFLNKPRLAKCVKKKKPWSDDFIQTKLHFSTHRLEYLPCKNGHHFTGNQSTPENTKNKVKYMVVSWMFWEGYILACRWGEIHLSSLTVLFCSGLRWVWRQEIHCERDTSLLQGTMHTGSFFTVHSLLFSISKQQHVFGRWEAGGGSWRTQRKPTVTQGELQNSIQTATRAQEPEAPY